MRLLPDWVHVAHSHYVMHYGCFGRPDDIKARLVDCFRIILDRLHVVEDTSLPFVECRSRSLNSKVMPSLVSCLVKFYIQCCV